MPTLDVSYTESGLKQVAVALEDDPQVYTLRFDFNEIAEAETAAGCNLMAALSYPQFATARQMRALLFALLRPAHPSVLITEAGTLLARDMKTMTTALNLVCGPAESEEDLQRILSAENAAGSSAD